MPGTIDTERPATRLEEELEELKHEEQQLEQKTDRVAFSNGLALVFSIAALMLAVVAVAVAFIEGGKSSNNGGGSAPSAGSAATSGPAPTSGMGSGHQGAMGGAATGTPGTVSVALGDMWVRPNVTSAPAGKVTFVARNTGQLPHELMIERMPIKMEGPGKPIEEAAQGMINDMDPGQSGKMTLRLKPGKYELFCNVPGHYAAGQHTVFTVTG